MSLNAYVYALSNPLTWIDPLGLSPVDASPMVTATSEANVSTGFVGGFVKGFLKTAAFAAAGIVAAAAAPVATAVVGTGLAVYGTVSNYQQRANEQIAAGRKVNKVGTFLAALGDTLGVTGGGSSMVELGVSVLLPPNRCAGCRGTRPRRLTEGRQPQVQHL